MIDESINYMNIAGPAYSKEKSDVFISFISKFRNDKRYTHEEQLNREYVFLSPMNYEIKKGLLKDLFTSFCFSETPLLIDIEDDSETYYVNKSWLREDENIEKIKKSLRYFYKISSDKPYCHIQNMAMFTLYYPGHDLSKLEDKVINPDHILKTIEYLQNINVFPKDLKECHPYLLCKFSWLIFDIYRNILNIERK
ncbi:hypothetical protein EZS27_020511 [termite gut metagenome]|uniref:Uncharacterized protein n=1 Tax=termite gut metagenome TaxID=433724 RepID=A0A5J4RDJ4_9ZZZZ